MLKCCDSKSVSLQTKNWNVLSHKFKIHSYWYFIHILCSPQDVSAILLFQDCHFVHVCLKNNLWRCMRQGLSLSNNQIMEHFLLYHILQNIPNAKLKGEYYKLMQTTHCMKFAEHENKKGPCCWCINSNHFQLYLVRFFMVK